MRLALIATVKVLLLAPSSYSCADHDHEYTHHRRGDSSLDITPPWRHLEWGDINIIQTTDSHGWLLGHQKRSPPEPNYSGNFGDFFSFVKHMRQIAIERDVDLLVVDSGDLHDGTGLSDGYPPGGVDAHDSNEFFQQLPYDALTVGNHELYYYNYAFDMFKNFVPRFNGRYLASNVNIIVNNSTGHPVSVPFGSRYAKFTTRKERRITALGILFNFSGNATNTTVQTVGEMVHETWFAEAIKEEPDFFLLLGHMPVSRQRTDKWKCDDKDLDQWPCVFHAIREVHPQTPILIFGGHTHVRNCTQLDDNSMSLMSGRYMETVGWMSANLTEKDKPTFTRRYLDANRVTYEYHTNQSEIMYNTVQGVSITQGLNDLYERFGLGSPYPSNTSLLSELVDKALPYSLRVNNTDKNMHNIILINSGSMRFDIYRGTFDRNDQWSTTYFNSKFQYIANVNRSIAEQVLPYLNGTRPLEREFEELEGRGEVEHIYRKSLQHISERLEDRDDLTLGYVTKDFCPGLGDDTLHKRLVAYDAPRYIGSPTPNVPANATIDLVFLDHFASKVVDALNAILKKKVYKPSDVKDYTSLLVNQVWGVYAEGNWP
ncbi:hypothetical protein APHAL10511_000286 [Amanita phalloides]|nr:hypothetical protein APHAL10511_000286 [Amanita phalloides]